MRRLWVPGFAAALLLAGCGDTPPPEPPPSGPPVDAAPSQAPPKEPAPEEPPDVGPYKPPERAERLKHPDTLDALFKQILDATQKKDTAAVQALVVSIVPTREELHQVLKDGPETEKFVAAYQGPVAETLGPAAPSDSLGFAPTHTEIHVHQATTEDLVAYAKGTTAYMEFPGGMQRFAKQVAAPGRTWYVVETREPGKESGIKYSCFTRLGNRFLLVVKPWRAIPETGGAPPK